MEKGLLKICSSINTIRRLAKIIRSTEKPCEGPHLFLAGLVALHKQEVSAKAELYFSYWNTESVPGQTQIAQAERHIDSRHLRKLVEQRLQRPHINEYKLYRTILGKCKQTATLNIEKERYMKFIVVTLYYFKFSTKNVNSHKETVETASEEMQTLGLLECKSAMRNMFPKIKETTCEELKGLKKTVPHYIENI